MSKPNLRVVANVMTPMSGEGDIARLPGDLAVRVYKGLWLSPQSIRRNLTDRQWVEYQQYLVCALCGRPCAGSCQVDGSPS